MNIILDQYISKLDNNTISIIQHIHIKIKFIV